MGEEESKELFHFEEWTIKNFSCWNREIHGNEISTPRSPVGVDYMLKLYPRGTSGCGEDLIVCLGCGINIVFSGELSFIGSDGSLLHTQQVDSEGNAQREITLPPGPKFEEVIFKLKKNLHLQGDRLLIRWRIKRGNPWESIKYRKTTLEVFSVTFRILPNIFEGLDSSGELISYLMYPFGKESIGQLKLRKFKDKTDSKKILLTLELDSFEKKISVHTHMSVLNNDRVVRTEENEYLFRDNERWTFVNSLDLDEVEGKDSAFILHFKLIPDNTSKRCASVYYYNSDAISLLTADKLGSAASIVLNNKSPKKEPKHSLKKLSEELMRLQQEQIFSDCELKCGAVTFSVHRNILSARSPVFKTMLSCDMQEAASGKIDITDLDPSTLSRFLTFLYTGDVGEELQGESAINLYYAADKYQVPTLKEECTDFLCDHVSLLNVCDLLSLANRHQSEQLIAVAQEFILRNYKEVLRSEEWKIFMRREPLLAVETVTELADKKI